MKKQKKVMGMKIQQINWGIASRVGDTIYLNKRLDKYPKLKSALITHENAHTSGPMTMRDFALDLDIKELEGLKGQYYKFLFSTPTAWAEFFPIKKYEDEWLFNFPVFLAWVLFIVGIIWLISGSF